MTRSNRHLHIDGYDELEDKIVVYKRIGFYEFKEYSNYCDETYKFILDEIIWGETKINLEEKQVKKYEEEEDFVHVYYTDGTKNKVRNFLNETTKEEFIERLDTILINQLKEDILNYELKKEEGPRKTTQKIGAIVGMAACLLIFPLSSIDTIIEVMNELKKKKKSIRIKKLYLANKEKLEQPIQIVKNKECITTKVTPMNLNDFSYKSLKKAIKTNR